MKKIIATALFVFLPIPGFAKPREESQSFRWSGAGGVKALRVDSAEAALSRLPPAETLLKGVGEFVARESQMVGAARVAGSWKQTILREDGTLAYAAGSVTTISPKEAAELHASEARLSQGLARGMQNLEELQSASRIFPPRLEVKKQGEGWLAYWRVEYLTPKADRLRFVAINEQGAAVDGGQLDWDGVDGRSYAFPGGEKLGSLKDVTLRDLSGDGTVTGKILHVVSELGLNVYSPDLTFFFAQTDRRFDLGQAYFIIDHGYRWLKDHLGVELDHPIEVRLHVGDGGVSNAAFYHENTIYLGTGDGVEYHDMLRDPTILVHESIHAVIDAYVGLPSEGEGGGFNEGFADLFAGLILDTPRMGENSYVPAPFYKRTMENQFHAYRDFAPGVYQNGTIVAGTFWDMKAELGTELTAKLAFRTLVRLGSGAKFDDFPSALSGAADGLLSPEQTAFVMKTAANRGWKITL